MLPLVQDWALHLSQAGHGCLLSLTVKWEVLENQKRVRSTGLIIISSKSMILILIYSDLTILMTVLVLQEAKLITNEGRWGWVPLQADTRMAGRDLRYSRWLKHKWAINTLINLWL